MQNPYHYQDDDVEASTLGSRSFGGGDGDTTFKDEEETISNSSRLADERFPSGGGLPPGTGSVHAIPRVVTAGNELESLCRAEMSGGNDSKILGFPPTCLPIVTLLAGNHCCVDCGDEDPDRMGWASIGYGTLLCQECAHRHATMAEPEESAVMSLTDDHWNLRSALALLEGSNTRMLDYVKHKPRWRPPKGSRDLYTEDTLAFKQIYNSKAAAAYRKILGRRVDDAFFGRITATRERDAALEDRSALAKMAAEKGPPDPFRRIFEQNDVSGEDIPGFFEASSRRHDVDNIAMQIRRRGAGGATEADISAARAARGLVRRLSSATGLGREPPSVETIKKRIERRRSMNSSIRRASQASTVDNMSLLGASLLGGDAAAPAPPGGPPDGDGVKNLASSVASAYLSQSSRRPPPGTNRRTSMDLGMVGEVGDAAMEEVEDQASIGTGSYRRSELTRQSKMWLVADNGEIQEDERTNQSFSNRAIQAASRAPLGTYRRLGAGVGSGR